MTCGHCGTRGVTVEIVRNCSTGYTCDAQYQDHCDEESARSEQLAELANERYFEERGGGYDPDEELRARGLIWA